MRKSFKILILWLLCWTQFCYSQTTNRVSEFKNDQVSVWKTTIYPGTKNILKMHRHDHDRIVVALDKGLIRITSKKGKMHYLHLQKNKSYYFKRDPMQEYHTDENLSPHPIHFIVIELA